MLTGLNAKLYYGDAGSEPDDEVTRVRDQEDGFTVGTAESSDHASNGWKDKAPTLLEGSISFKLTWDGTEAGQVAIQTAHDAGSKIALKSVDQANGYGFWGDCIITEFSHDQPLEDGMSVSVTAKVDGALTPVSPTP